MQRITDFILCLFFILILLTGCTNNGQLVMNSEACLSPLKWGMTETIALKALYKAGIQCENQEKDSRIYQIKTKILDIPAVVALRFFGDLPLREKEEPVLTAISVWFQETDIETVIERISAVLGERETQQIAYRRHGEDETIDKSVALDEDKRNTWYADRNLLDLFSEEQLKKAFALTESDLVESSILKRFYLSYLYTATLHDTKDGGCLLEINGVNQVYANQIKQQN